MPLESATPQKEPSQPLERGMGSLLGVDYGSDDEEAEQEKDQQDVVDALEPQNVLEEALETPQEDYHSEPQETVEMLKPKIEEIDDTTMLQLDIDIGNTQADAQQSNDAVDRPAADVTQKDEKTRASGLKSISSDPLLGHKSTSNSSSDSETPAVPGKSALKQLYAPLRERILDSDIEKLFLDLDDFHISRPNDTKGDVKEPGVLDLPPADLPSLFPDLQPFDLLDVPPPSAPVVAEGKKKSEKRSDRDDPTKRIEDTTYTKLFPIGQFMYSKPTLIGPLQPSKNWKDGKWLPMDASPVWVEYEGPMRPPEDAMNGMLCSNLNQRYPRLISPRNIR
jgi:chromatin modification-related protein VID21